MRSLTCPASCCRHCRYYTHEGRRGGQCEQLNVPVQGSWKACSLASPAFTPTWETFKEMIKWHEEPLTVQEVETASTSDSPSVNKALPV